MINFRVIILIILFGLTCTKLQSQNSLGIQVGFQGSYTAIAEYERTDRRDFLLDSMVIDKYAGSFQASLNIDIGLGSNFFLSNGFHYSRKGLSSVDFIDSTGYTWHTPARQHYAGLSVLLGYYIHPRNPKFVIQVATGLQADFAVGTPNGGALFSGPYHRFFMPFSRFNEVDLGWRSEVGASYLVGPGSILVKLSYIYGLSDVLEDAFVIGRSQSLGISVGYVLKLSK